MWPWLLTHTRQGHETTEGDDGVTRTTPRKWNDCPIHNIHMSAKLQVPLKIKFRMSQRNVCVWQFFRHITSNMYQHTDELTLICDIYWSHIANAVSCHTLTFLSFIQMYVSSDHIRSELQDHNYILVLTSNSTTPNFLFIFYTIKITRVRDIVNRRLRRS